MTISKAAFLWAIAQEESGQSYSAHNPNSGAIGKYQVMPSNVASWTRRALGYSMTPAQFAASPSAQEKVAQVVLGGDYDKYGPEGAASVWFSGQPNPNKVGNDGSTSIRQYVNNVMSLGGKYSGQSAGGGGGAVGASAVTPKLSMDELAANYGLSSALINSSKELKNLFNQAVKGSWSADLFTAKLKNTNWWKTQPDSLRQYITTKYTDPATWKQKYGQGISDMNSIAVQVGLGNQVDGKGQSSKLLQTATYYSLALGWSDARIKDWLGGQVQGHAGVMWGEAGDTYDKLQSIAYLNGIKLNTSWYTNNVRAVESGKSTESQLEDSIRKTAAARYSAFRPQILAGQNVMDLASPYIQSVAKILEIPSSDVDLFNSHVAKAMSSNTNGQAMSIWSFENSLRQDPLWKKTQNAQDSAMQTAHQVLQSFGQVF
jgi:hypothetical protein